MKKSSSDMHPRLTLDALTAADLMSPNPVSIGAEAWVREAISLLVDKCFGAAPVIDAAGRPVGVVSQSDILVHERERDDYVRVGDDSAPADEAKRTPGRGFNVVDIDRTRVADIMTPAVFTVSRDTPATRVLENMLALKVHHLFVVDEKGVLVGVISSHDLLRHLHREPLPPVEAVLVSSGAGKRHGA